MQARRHIAHVDTQAHACSPIVTFASMHVRSRTHAALVTFTGGKAIWTTAMMIARGTVAFDVKIATLEIIPAISAAHCWPGYAYA